MLKEKNLYVFCGPRGSYFQSSEESVGMGNEEERIIRGFGEISDKSLRGRKDKSQHGF